MATRGSGATCREVDVQKLIRADRQGEEYGDDDWFDRSRVVSKGSLGAGFVNTRGAMWFEMVLYARSILHLQISVYIWNVTHWR